MTSTPAFVASWRMVHEAQCFFRLFVCSRDRLFVRSLFGCYLFVLFGVCSFVRLVCGVQVCRGSSPDFCCGRRNSPPVRSFVCVCACVRAWLCLFACVSCLRLCLCVLCFFLFTPMEVTFDYTGSPTGPVFWPLAL
jgi:hypothetical protein